VPLVPLDHPTPQRPHRRYVALTNHCNRACPWCSTFSSPAGSTFLPATAFAALLPRDRPFELQLEGGEPTLHPQFLEFVALARTLDTCTRIVLCSNGVVVPRQPARLRKWLTKLGTPLTLKLSVNHYLLDRDPGLLALAAELLRQFQELGGDRLLVLNVRLRRGVEYDDRRVREAVEQAGLADHANFFFLQRYGLATSESSWEPPAPVWDAFDLINPDGSNWGTDLVARSAAMGRLP
jgi:MoaA/NifB/PqqE/SkfB family radical SAM enzyme